MSHGTRSGPQSAPGVSNNSRGWDGASEKPHHRQKYPWGCWLDGEVHILKHGTDFQVSVEQFQHYVYTQGRLRHGASMATRRLGDVVLIQAVA